MAAMEIGNVSAGGLDDRPWLTPEDMERFLAGSRAEYAIPGAELRIRASRGDSNAAMDLFVVQTTQRRRIEALNAPSPGEPGKGDAYGQFHLPESCRLPESRRLADALAELAEVDDEIAEDNLPKVGEATKTEAERLVRALTRCAPARALLAVYPTQDAGIALHFKEPDRPNAVLVLLRDDGRADCHAYIGGRSRRAHYNTSSDLPDAFVLDQLRRLARSPRVGVSTLGAGFSPSWTFPSTNLLLTW